MQNRFPLEIRNMIYAHLVPTTAVEFVCELSTPPYTSSPPLLMPRELPIAPASHSVLILREEDESLRWGSEARRVLGEATVVELVCYYYHNGAFTIHTTDRHASQPAPLQDKEGAASLVFPRQAWRLDPFRRLLRHDPFGVVGPPAALILHARFEARLHLAQTRSVIVAAAFHVASIGLLAKADTPPVIDLDFHYADAEDRMVHLSN
jgi:hypothetical protein